MDDPRHHRGAYDETLAVNLKGTFLACQQAIPALIERGGGSIVNIGSVVGIRDAGTGETAYAASKAGQLGLTVELAGAYGRDNIRVNTVLPGMIASAMLQAVSTRDGRVRSKLNLLGRIGEVKDVANAVCFLCSDEARLHHGCRPSGRWGRHHGHAGFHVSDPAPTED